MRPQPVTDPLDMLLQALGPQWRLERGINWSGCEPPWYMKKGGLVYCSHPAREGLFKAFVERRTRCGMTFSEDYLRMFQVPEELYSAGSEEELLLKLEVMGT